MGKFAELLNAKLGETSQQIESLKEKDSQQVSSISGQLDSKKEEIVAGQKMEGVASQQGDRHKIKSKVTVRMSEDQLTEIKSFCKTHEVQIQDFFAIAASHYIDYVASQPALESANKLATKSASHTADNVASQQANKLIFKTSEDIIKLYHQFTSKRWTAVDDKAASRFNGADRRLLEIAMINVWMQARGKKINSFGYFTAEIEQLFELGIDQSNIDLYLTRRRELFDKCKKEWNK